MNNNEINPFGLHKMVGIGIRKGNSIKQIKPNDDGMTYLLRYNSRRVVLCPEWGLAVVCNIRGEFPKPIPPSQPFSFPYSFKNVFFGKELITVEAHYDLESFSINRHRIIYKKRKTYTVETETIWGGFYEKLPQNMECFRKAIELAKKRKYGKY